MARLSRLYVSGQAQHVVQRGRDLQDLFDNDADYVFFAELLGAAARQFGLAIHSYVLMPGQFNLLATPQNERSIGLVLQAVGRRYVAYFNRKYQRTGSLWQGRFRSTIIDEAFALFCSCYIELRPLHAGLVADPKLYRWSSCAHHAGAATDRLVADHAQYWALGNTPFERQSRYRTLLERELPVDQVSALVIATEKGWAFGRASFIADLQPRATRRVSPRARGRPALARAKSNRF